jgi:hypothetical protein
VGFFWSWSIVFCWIIEEFAFIWTVAVLLKHFAGHKEFFAASSKLRLFERKTAFSA